LKAAAAEGLEIELIGKVFLQMGKTATSEMNLS
jgi:hypothetical protein